MQYDDNWVFIPAAPWVSQMATRCYMSHSPEGAVSHTNIHLLAKGQGRQLSPNNANFETDGEL